MHVVAYGAQIVGSRSIDQERLVTSRKKMTAQFVPPVKTHRIGAQQPLHSFDQICSWRFYHQMKMIAHQTVGVHLPPGLLASCAQGLEKISPIPIIAKDLFTPIAPTHQMIDRPFVLNSQLPRHRQVLIEGAICVNSE